MNQPAHNNGNGHAAGGGNGSEIEPAMDRAVGAVIGSAVELPRPAYRLRPARRQRHCTPSGSDR